MTHLQSSSFGTLVHGNKAKLKRPSLAGHGLITVQTDF